MRNAALIVFAVFGLVITSGARAQIVPPPIPSIIPPPPAPSAPPPPKIEVPVVPKMETPAPKAKSAPRRSFNDRIEGCFEDAYAARLMPGDRVAYSRYCANRVE